MYIEKLKSKVSGNATAAKYMEDTKMIARNRMNMPLLEHGRIDGVRMLSKCKEARTRIENMAFSYKMTGDTTFADGAIAVNETSFVSNYPMVYFEAHGEDGYVRMEGERVFKSSSKTEGKLVEVELGDSLPLPIEQFMTGNILDGCSMEEAKALTHMMTLAYNNIQ